jgi:diaminohydroxyphosphoribosylaminopyrimidine deaminase/5-amino-6-(5-phosphoribosylamino)uracil reductase
VDELLLYMAPMLVGDAAHGLFNLAALTKLEDATRLELRDVRQVGRDIRVVARLPRA